jgi:hypothetical protein
MRADMGFACAASAAKYADDVGVIWRQVEGTQGCAVV